jgi:predicted amidohydrolase YtcJ
MSLKLRPQIYANAAVFTGIRRQPWVEACAVRGAYVLGVGAVADLRRDWPSASEHDLAGSTLLPGLIDAHNHFLSTGESLASLDLRYPAVDSPQATRMDERIGSLEPGKAADLTIVGGDLRSAGAAEIAELPVVATIVAGEAMFDDR